MQDDTQGITCRDDFQFEGLQMITVTHQIHASFNKQMEMFSSMIKAFDQLAVQSPAKLCAHISDHAIAIFTPRTAVGTNNSTSAVVLDCSDLPGVRGPCCQPAARDVRWVCLACRVVLCGSADESGRPLSGDGRNKTSHVTQHCTSAGHPLAIHIASAGIWCFKCAKAVGVPSAESDKKDKAKEGKQKVPVMSVEEELAEQIRHVQAHFLQRPSVSLATDKPRPLATPNCSALVYDPTMRLHCEDPPHGHPEQPDRITKIFERMTKDSLVRRCRRVGSRQATQAEVRTVHSQQWEEELLRLSKLQGDELEEAAMHMDSIYLNQHSRLAAYLSAGSVCELVSAVLEGHVRSGAAVVRPPGHHAEAHTAMGFCLLNNVAIAARMATDQHGLKRVLIVDWDVHHGNGTQHMFYEDPRVLYVSLHRYDDGFFYPCSEDAYFDRIGKGPGRGFNINVSWNERMYGDHEYLHAFKELIMPVATEFAPELVLVSAGFDAAAGDPLGGMQVTPVGYAHMTRTLQGLAQGRVVLALEGGYNLDSISASYSACLSMLQGAELPACPALKVAVSPQAAKAVEAAQKVLAPYWRCLEHCRTPPTPGPTASASVDSPSTTEAKTQTWTCTSCTLVNEASKSPELCAVCGELRPGSARPKDSLPGAAPHTRRCAHVAEHVQVEAKAKSLVPLESKCQQADCYNKSENWICLRCGEVYCGRWARKHFLVHHAQAGHALALGTGDLSIWCYECDSYVDSAAFPVLQAIYILYHTRKFGEPPRGVAQGIS
eukprot:g32369.t1